LVYAGYITSFLFKLQAGGRCLSPRTSGVVGGGGTLPVAFQMKYKN